MRRFSHRTSRAFGSHLVDTKIVVPVVPIAARREQQGYQDNVQQRLQQHQAESMRRNERIAKSNARFTVQKLVDNEVREGSTYIGIDLGTTNSCISVIDSETKKPKIIPSPTGSWVFPTAITFDRNHTVRLFGEEARACAATSASATVCSGKRLIGRRYGELGNVTAQMSKTNLISINDRGEVSIEVSGRIYSVTHITGMFLRYLKECAEEYLGKPVDSAVVSVPAYFSPQQKVATEDAALIAGFDVLEIIDEPSAACLTYSILSPKSAEKKRVQSNLVFDLGGGTLDCALMDHDTETNTFALVATHGDPLLGGNDWDNVIAKQIVDRFRQRWKIDLDAQECRPTESAADHRQVLIEAERAKVHFTHSTEDYHGYHRHFHFSEVRREIVPLQVDLTWKQYVELTRPLRERCIDCLDRLFEAAGRDPQSVDNILLVGAMTRDPPVRGRLEKYFGREPSAHNECPPDYAVAIGAAVRAGMLKGMFPELSRNLTFVRGSLQAEQSSLIERSLGTVKRMLAAGTYINPNAIGHKWRGVANGLSNDQIENYAKELVEFEAGCKRRQMLEKVEGDANTAMQRLTTNSYKKQGMQESIAKQLTDQLKFWQYMVHNFHDHEEQLQRTINELNAYLDDIEGKIDDNVSVMTPEGRIDFTKSMRNLKTQRIRRQVLDEDEEEPEGANRLSSAADSTPPVDEAEPSTAPSSVAPSQEATRKSSRTKVIRREVPLPKTATVDELVDKGNPAFTDDNKPEFFMSERTREESFKEYVENRAWREPPSPPGEEGKSWGDVKKLLDAGEVVGEVMETNDAPRVTLVDRLQWLQQEFPVVLSEKADDAILLSTAHVVQSPFVKEEKSE